MFQERPTQTNRYQVSKDIPAIAMLLLLVLTTNAAQAQDTIDGAIWRFTMKPKTQGLQILKGQFRVSNHVLFQKEKPEQNDFNKQIGVNKPNKDKTVMTLTDLRAMDKKRNWHNGFKGKVLLRNERFGFWTGRFIDSQGRHWDFTCSRIQD